MKKFITWLVSPYSLGAVAVAIVVVAVLVNGRCHSRRTAALLNRQWKENQIILQERRKEDSAQITTAMSNYITREDLRNSDDAMVDSLRKSLVGPIRTLERTTRILVSRIDSLIIPVRDTTRTLPSGAEQRGYAFNYSRPPYLTFMRGFLFPGDSLHLEYGLKSEYILEHHWKQAGLFKPKELQLIITSKDPAVNVDRVQQFQVVSPVKWWQRPGVVGPIAFGTGLIVGLAVNGR